MHSAHESMENVAELGLGGAMPVFDADPPADEPLPDGHLEDQPVAGG